MSAKTPAKGHASKHVHKAAKHHKAKGKHHQAHVTNPVPSFRPVPPHVAGKPAHHPKPRGFAVGDLLPVCALEAVAMSLRLAGQPVSDDDVAGLWELAGGRELEISEALDAFGVAGFGLDGFRPVALGADLGMGVNPPDPGHQLAPQIFHRLDTHALILGVDVPGPHSVLATPDGWWSWGELHDPWPCRIEEAWAVSWS